MKTAQWLPSFVILLFGSLAIGGRIHGEMQRQVRAEELRVDRSIHELRELAQKRADKASSRSFNIGCGLGLKSWSAEDLPVKSELIDAERRSYQRLVREFDKLLELRDKGRFGSGGATEM